MAESSHSNSISMLLAATALTVLTACNGANSTSSSKRSSSSNANKNNPYHRVTNVCIHNNRLRIEEPVAIVVGAIVVDTSTAVLLATLTLE